MPVLLLRSWYCVECLLLKLQCKKFYENHPWCPWDWCILLWKTQNSEISSFQNEPFFFLTCTKFITTLSIGKILKTSDRKGLLTKMEAFGRMTMWCHFLRGRDHVYFKLFAIFLAWISISFMHIIYLAV